MVKKKKVGRPAMKSSEKKKLMPAYFNEANKRLIVNKFGSLTKAVEEKILPDLNI